MYRGAYIPYTLHFLHIFIFPSYFLNFLNLRPVQWKGWGGIPPPHWKAYRFWSHHESTVIKSGILLEKPTKTQFIKRKIVLRCIIKASQFIKDKARLCDLKLNIVEETIKKMADKYIQCLHHHHNIESIQFLGETARTRRLKRLKSLRWTRGASTWKPSPPSVGSITHSIVWSTSAGTCTPTQILARLTTTKTQTEGHGSPPLLI